jgi:GT2 family glycosyltransferase|tara:strand:- start:1459 stop:2328 length:870 start_codon:yes stop_codon:yes gene_type:complete
MNPANYKDKLTIIIVSFYSNHIIENLIKKLDKSIKILVIENSLNHTTKINLEKKFNNVKVIIPEKNLGNGGGINLGFSLVKTEFSLYLDVDTVPENNMIQVLLENAEKIKNYSILAPKVTNFDYGEDLYIHYEKSKKIHQIKFITGCVLLFNMKALSKTGYFDENIFLYYEEHDLYFRCNKLNLPIYLIDDAKVFHEGSSSVNIENNHEISINRNWHYCWSKFYYFKKNYGYLFGIKKTIPNFVRALKKYLFYSIKFEKKEALLHKAEIQGLIASYCLQKSFRRPEVNN